MRQPALTEALNGNSSMIQVASFSAYDDAETDALSPRTIFANAAEDAQKNSKHNLSERERELMNAFEGLDYEPQENEYYKQEQVKLMGSRWMLTRHTICEWLVTFGIGFGTCWRWRWCWWRCWCWRCWWWC